MGPSLRDKIIGLGDRSTRKSYYPQLRQQLEHAEEDRSRLEDRSAALLNMLEDLEEARRGLAESQARYRSLVENISDVIFSLDVEGGVTYVSPVIQGLSGLTPDEIVGRPFLELVHPDDRSALSGVFERMLEGQPDQHEFRLLRKDGDSRDVRASSRPLTEEGRVVGLTCVMSDITERKRAEEALRESEEKYRTLLQKIRAAVVVHGADTRIQTSNSMAHELLGLTEDQMLGKTGIDPAWHFYREDGTVMPPEEYPVAKVVATRQALRDYVLGVHRPGKEAGSDVWVLVNGDPVLDQEGELAQVIVTFVDITDRKKAEEALRAERGLFVAGPTVVFRWKAEEGWPVEYVSPNVADQLGYTPEELTSGKILYASIVHPDDLERVGAEVSTYGERGEISFEQVYRIAHPDGGYRWVDDFTTVIKGPDGAITHYLGYVLDITERKQAEEELAKSQELLRDVMDFSPSLIYLVDLDGRFQFANVGLAELLQTSREELIGKDRSRVMPKEAAEQHRANDLEVIKDKKARSFTEESLVAGETHYYDSIKFPLLDPNGDVYAVGGISTDVTERMRAEEALRESERGLKEAQRLAGIGNWDWDAATDTITWSEEYYHIYGIDPAQRPPGYEEHLKAYTPESAARLDAAVQKNMQTGEPYEVDLELAHTGGPARWVTARSETKRDAEGRIVGLRGTAQDITERKRAEEALRESSERYRRTLDSMMEGCQLVGFDWRYLYINDAAVGHGRETKEGLLGHTMMEVYPGIEETEMFAALRRCMDDRTPLHMDNKFTYPDGTSEWFELSMQPVPEGVFILSIDVTERKLGEEALRASQQRLALHVEQTLLGVIEWDADFRVTEWNPAAEAIFGYRSEEVVGRNASDFILSKALRPEIDARFDHLVQEKASEFNINENVTKDGRTILCEWVNTPLVDESGIVVGGMSLARDITERRQAEELRIAKEAAERASVAKSTFLANMSHEIRTPMNAILGFAQLMRRDKGLSKHQRQQLDIINASGEHLLALINDVLEMSKVEAGRISANLTAFSLHSLLDEMNSLFSLRAEAKGLELRVVCSDEVPRFVVTDENKLRQILVNLLGNAVKFTDTGSIELRVDVRHEEGGKLRLLAEVEDTGRGIAPEDMGRLFQYFEQAAAGREMETGTGLGLAISREFVHLLGGDIEVESTLGAGSTFKFDITVEEATAEAVAGGAEERRVVGLRPGEPRYRVLVADDAPDNRELLAQMLEPVGFSVRCVADGRAALEEFEEWRPRLVLMDMRMPVMDGYEATRRIRAMPGGADVAIIGVTASAFAEMRQGVFDAGVDEFVGKPFHESELFDKIAQLLGAHYVYEEEKEEATPEPEVESMFSAEALAALPKDLTDRIRNATVSADFDAVLELADEVGRIDERLAAALRNLAERYDSDQILAALPGGERS